jgi:type IV pilus assembly protein PilB
MRQKIAECLVHAGLITEGDLQVALAEHKRTGERIGVVLVRMNFATEKQIANVLALQLGFPFVNLKENPPDPSAAARIPEEVCVKHVCVGVSVENNLLTVAMSDPLLFSLVQALEVQTGCRIRQVVATRGDILDAIRTCYPHEAPAGPTPAVSEPAPPASSLRENGERGDTNVDDAAIADLVDRVVAGAVKSKASDVHIEPTEHGVLIRQRLDGLLKNVMDLPRSVYEGLIARLKSTAGMDVAETRLPQDGRIRATGDGAAVDFRVSTLRTLFGEKVVMRVLDRRKDVPALEEIGLSTTALEETRAFLRHQHGMILVVGPAGSGKSTTLSAALKSVRSEKANIVTIEDPIEYHIPGVNQTQIDEKIGLTFASALRSIVRQDPDVILIGEIRDAEVAKIALQAAQTGQLVLSSLPADDAPSAVSWLADIGAEPHAIATALVGVVAQRLVRGLCVQCRRQYTPSAAVLRFMNISEADAASIPFYTAVGCDQCNHTGYRGRVGIYEVMTVTEKLRRLIAARVPEEQIREAARAAGMISLGEDALAKAKSGVTSPEELRRVVTEVREMRALCSGCGSVVGVDYMACPHCGKRLNAGCPHCGRALQPGWHFCHYCARSTEEKRQRKRGPDREPREIARRPLPPGNVAEFKK